MITILKIKLYLHRYTISKGMSPFTEFEIRFQEEDGNQS